MARRGKIAAGILLIAALCANAGGADAIRLAFRPEVGRKQTVRITSHMASIQVSPKEPGATERHWVLTLEIEPLSIGADGAVTLRATIVRIQHRLSANPGPPGAPLYDLDSAEGTPDDKDKSRWHGYQMGMCLAPIGESFTVIVSARGRIIGGDTEAFCRAVVRKRMQYENEAIEAKVTSMGEWAYRNESERKRRKLIQADVAKAIRDENARYGSLAEREKNCRAAALESHLYSMSNLEWLMNDLLVPFPAEPVAPGGRWTGPVMLRADGPIELEGTYTLKDQGNGACTILVEAQRTMNDQPYGAPAVPFEHRTRLEGTYQATLKIDRVTGVLLSKEASMDMTGRTSTYMPDIPNSGRIVKITARATNAVESVY